MERRPLADEIRPETLDEVVGQKHILGPGGVLRRIIENGTKVNATELLALNIYSTYNIKWTYHGVAQAKAVIFFLLVAVLAIAQQTLTGRKEVQQ